MTYPSEINMFYARLPKCKFTVYRAVHNLGCRIFHTFYHTSGENSLEKVTEAACFEVLFMSIAHSEGAVTQQRLNTECNIY